MATKNTKKTATSSTKSSESQAPVAKTVKLKVPWTDWQINGEGATYRAVDGVLEVPKELADKLAWDPMYQVIG